MQQKSTRICLKSLKTLTENAVKKSSLSQSDENLAHFEELYEKELDRLDIIQHSADYSWKKSAFSLRQSFTEKGIPTI